MTRRPRAVQNRTTSTTTIRVEALRRQRLGRHVAAEIRTLRADPEAWADYVADADGPTLDGIV